MMNNVLKFVLLFLLYCFSLFLTPKVSSAQTEKTYGLAVLDLQAIGISEIEAKALSDMLRSSITRIIIEKSDKTTDSYELIERSQMDKIFEQFEIQNTGCTDLSCAVEFGKMLNVERIVIGSVSLVGSTYMVIARIVDVESSRTIYSVDRKQRGEIDNVIDLMPLVGHELLTGERLAAPVPAIPSTTAPVTTTPTPTEPQQEIRPREQYLSVSGTPEAAEVFLNDELIGQTPIDYRRVNPGRYTVKIVRKGYVDFKDEIVVPPGGNESISYKLTPYASLSVSGSPDNAAVFLNGKEIGKTPVVNYMVPAGKYAVK
ncbi:MAG TPA: PEGA domain-containing protein, partial [bacterium]|nr:PEGA domain-containing protein [bacterium]